jgi:hypothetical protein
MNDIATVQQDIDRTIDHIRTINPRLLTTDAAECLYEAYGDLLAARARVEEAKRYADTQAQSGGAV